MGWSNGIYTRARDFTDDEANSIKMLSVNFDEEHDEIETGLNFCLTKDGQNSASANLPMSTHRHTGCGDAVERNEYASLGQVQDGTSKAAVTGGLEDDYTLTLSPTLTAYANGQVFFFKAHVTCTGATVMNVDELGDIAVVQNLVALEAGDITLNRTYMIVYYTAQFHLFSQIAAASTPQYKVMQEIYTSDDTWTCPVGVVKAIVKCWGGGGGAGNAYGGQGGCYAESHVTVVPLDEYDINVGLGGAALAAGQDTTFDNTAVIAKGGAPNGSSQSTGCVGDFVSYGGTGLQYTKDMDSAVEGYFGGWAFGTAPARDMFMNGAVPGGGGAMGRPSSMYSGAPGMITVEWVELV